MASKNDPESLQRKAEADALISLNQELESVLGSSTQQGEAEISQTLDREQKYRNLISSRGFEVFDFEEVRKNYDAGIPVLRNFQLPLAKPVMKQHAQFWAIFTPVCGTFVHLMFHLRKYNTYENWLNRRLAAIQLGVFMFGFGSSSAYSYFYSPYLQGQIWSNLNSLATSTVSATAEIDRSA